MTLEEQPDVQPEPSTGALKDVEQFTPAERHEWLLSGKIPLAGDTAEEAPPSGEEHEESAAGSDAGKPAPASQPDGKQEQPKSQQPQKAQQPPPREKSKGVPARVQELLEKNRQLEERLAQATSTETGVTRTPPPAQPIALAPPPRPQTVTAPIPEDDPVPVPQAQPDGKPWPGATRAEQWQAYSHAQLDWTRRQTVRDVQFHQANEAIRTRWVEAENTVAQQPEFADYRQVIGTLRINEQTKAFVLRNPDVGPKILYLLGKNPQAAAQAAALGPVETLELLTEMRVILRGSAPAPSAAAAKSAAPKVKPSRSPDPVVDIGARKSAPLDDEMEAVKRDDVRGFMALDLRKRLAQHSSR